MCQNKVIRSLVTNHHRFRGMSGAQASCVRPGQASTGGVPRDGGYQQDGGRAARGGRGRGGCRSVVVRGDRGVFILPISVD